MLNQTNGKREKGIWIFVIDMDDFLRFINGLI